MITSIEEFLRCAESKDGEDYGRVTRDSMTPEVWQIILDCYPEHHDWITSNWYLPEWMMFKLAESKDYKIRKAVACRYDLPEKLIEHLSKEKDGRVKIEIGRNIACPDYILERLAVDKHAIARQGVAQNKRAPKRLLRVLVNDPIDFVRECAIDTLEIIQTRGIPKIPPVYRNILIEYEWMPDPYPDE